MKIGKRSIFPFAATIVVVATPRSAVGEPSHNVQATESKYGIDVYECNENFEEISLENRQRKNQGDIFRACFRPNEAARNDDVHIKLIEKFTWEMEHEDGWARQVAIENNQGDGHLSEAACFDDLDLCYSDTLFSSNFFKHKGSVQGTGTGRLTVGEEPVPLDKWIFQADFKFKWTDGNGNELTDEEQEELMRLYQEQQDALEAEELSSDAEESPTSAQSIVEEEQPTCDSSESCDEVDEKVL